jgi:hypothetical protein
MPKLAPVAISLVLTAGTPVITLGKAFYVYLIRDPRYNVPVYVGKGRGHRARVHLRKSSNVMLDRMIAKCRKQGLEPLVEIVARFTDEADAFALEIALIAKYGRRDLGTGTLFNFSDGGEGASGSIIHRKALADALRKLHANPKWQAAQAERMKKLHANPEFARARDERARKLGANPGEAHAVGIRKREANPKFARERDERSRAIFHKLNADPGFARVHAERASKRMQERWSDPNFRELNAERARKQNTNSSLETREKIAAGVKRYWAARRAAKGGEPCLN